MLSNTFTHPPTMSYDYAVQSRAVRLNQSWTDLVPHSLPGALEYNPPFYYLFGKFNHVGELLIRQTLDPYYLFRIGHSVIIVGMAALYVFDLLPRLLKNRLTIIWSALAFFVIPNLFLAQVMVRADHLLFLFVHLLFYLWFRFDFAHTLAASPWRLWTWAGCLVGMSNARNFALPAFLLFLAWGSVVIFHEIRRSRSIQYTVAVGGLIGIILLLSGSYYLQRYLATGRLISQSVSTPYHQYYFERQQGFDRRELFFNFQFDELLKTPNRAADFRGGNAFLPRLYGDMWADHWLYFSGPQIVTDTKVIFKRLVLVLAVPFTVIYFLASGLQALSAIHVLLMRRSLMWHHTAALLFWGVFTLFICFVFDEPFVGKNSTIKFCYLLAYYWFPLLSLARFLDWRPRLLRLCLAYTMGLIILCLPLSIYILRI